MNDIYMEEAIKEALKANQKNEIPVGAVIVDRDGNIIGRGHNNKEETNLIISHAEVNAIIDANKKINNWRLNDCDIYVTLEPCEMCKKIIKESRIKKIYYSSNNFGNQIIINPKITKITNNELINKTDKIINDAFIKIRNK